MDAFSIVSAEGKVLNSSGQWPVQQTELSDRDDFEHVRDHDTNAPFIGRPVRSGGGGWTATIGQRIGSASGRFLGVERVAVDLRYFEEFYRAVTIGADTTVTLLRRDGTVLASYPATARVGEALPASSPSHAAVAEGVTSLSGSLPRSITGPWRRSASPPSIRWPLSARSGC